MTTPYIQLVSPSVGLTAGGQLVEIRGFGFRLRQPSSVAARAGARGRPSPTVRVLFGDREARNVQVISRDILRVQTPRHPPSAWVYESTTSGMRVPAPPPTAEPAPVAPDGTTYEQITNGTIDVTVQNLDDAGAPIAGEEYVFPNAFTFRRPRLDVQGTWSLLLEGLANELFELVTPNVAFNPSLDYDPDTGGLTSITGLASLPGVALLSVDIATSESTMQNDREVTIDEDEGIVALQRRPTKRDFRVDMLIVSDNPDELLLLAQIVDETINIGLKVQIPSDDPNAPPHEYSWLLPNGIQIPQRQGRGELLVAQAQLFAFDVTSFGVPGATFDGTLDTPSWLQGTATKGITRTAKFFRMHVVPKTNA